MASIRSDGGCEMRHRICDEQFAAAYDRMALDARMVSMVGEMV
jgi:hypothetical protein